MTKNNAIFVIIGNCNTFIQCIDSCYDNIISQLFLNNNYNIYIYLHLKLLDHDLKEQKKWNLINKNIDYNSLIQKINDIKSKYKDISIEYNIILNNEITNNELLNQVKDRSKYCSYYAIDNILYYGLHNYYDFESCGKYILEKEKSIENTFDYIIYMRPDLYFINK